MRHFSKLFAASTLAVLGLTARGEDSALAAPSQAPSATAEPTPAPANRAPAASPGKGSLYYDSGKRPAPSRPGDSSVPQFTPGVRHHTGAYIRIDGGLGYSSTSMQMDIADIGALQDMKLTGLTPTLGVSLGGSVSQDLILAARFYLTATPNLTASAGGVSAEVPDTALSTVGIGPELVYYFMPANVYVSATVALTRQTMEFQGMSGSTDVGIGFQFGLGKQWWVGERWALGIGGQFSYTSNSDSGVTLGHWSTAGVVALSMN